MYKQCLLANSLCIGTIDAKVSIEHKRNLSCVRTANGNLIVWRVFLACAYTANHGKLVLHATRCLNKSFLENWRCICKDTTMPARKCKHRKFKRYCEICTPPLICDHGAWKKNCLKCTPYKKCIHGVRKTNCLICSPLRVCDHGKRKHNCLICTPSMLCKHNIRKYGCQICKRALKCRHHRRRDHCTICSPRDELLALLD